MSGTRVGRVTDVGMPRRLGTVALMIALSTSRLQSVDQPGLQAPAGKPLPPALLPFTTTQVVSGIDCHHGTLHNAEHAALKPASQTCCLIKYTLSRHRQEPARHDIQFRLVPPNATLNTDSVTGCGAG